MEKVKRFLVHIEEGGRSYPAYFTPEELRELLGITQVDVNTVVEAVKPLIFGSGKNTLESQLRARLRHTLENETTPVLQSTVRPVAQKVEQVEQRVTAIESVLSPASDQPSVAPLARQLFEGSDNPRAPSAVQDAYTSLLTYATPSSRRMDPDPMTFIRAYPGGEGLGARGGQYFTERGLSGNAVSMAVGLMTTGDLRFLDFLCTLFMRREEALEGPGTTRGDESGPGAKRADGHLGVTYGTDAQGRIQPHTGSQVPLEASIGRLGNNLTLLMCRVNQDRFSPAHEPPSSRPATPQFYKRIADKAEEIEQHVRATWSKYWEGKHPWYGGNPHVAKLPGYPRKSFTHPLSQEGAANLAYALAVGGENYKEHQDYKDGVAIIRHLLDDRHTSGKNGTVCARDTSSGRVMFFAQRALRYDTERNGTVNNGSNISARQQFTQPGTYADETFRGLAFTKLFAPEAISDAEMEQLARGCSLGLLPERLVSQSTPLWAGNASDGGRAFPDPWSGQTSSTYEINRWLSGVYGILAPWDKTGRIRNVTRRWWELRNKFSTVDGAQAVLLFDAFVRNGMRRA